MLHQLYIGSQASSAAAIERALQGALFCILKTTGSAGASKKLSLYPDYLSERSEESSSLLLREKGDHGSGG
jgi:hypothetical protein